MAAYIGEGRQNQGVRIGPRVFPVKGVLFYVGVVAPISAVILFSQGIVNTIWRVQVLVAFCHLHLLYFRASALYYRYICTGPFVVIA